jgi:hypothetical protein
MPPDDTATTVLHSFHEKLNEKLTEIRYLPERF